MKRALEQLDLRSLNWLAVMAFVAVLAAVALVTLGLVYENRFLMTASSSAGLVATSLAILAVLDAG